MDCYGKNIFFYIKDDHQFSCIAVALASNINDKWCFRDQTKLTTQLKRQSSSICIAN